MAEPIELGNGLLLDGEAVCDSNGYYVKKSQRDWESYLAGIGKRLPTLAEYIVAFKQLNERNDPALRGIMQDLQENVLCTGTKVDYRSSNIPIGDGYLDVLMKDSAWQRALEDELFHYDAKEAVKILQEASAERPGIETPSAEGRRSCPERPVWLGINTGRFYLHCRNSPIDGGGRSRGARTIGSNWATPPDLMPEPKILSAQVVNNHHLEDKPKEIYSKDDLAYARRLLDGVPSGTVMEWKKH